MCVCVCVCVCKCMCVCNKKLWTPSYQEPREADCHELSSSKVWKQGRTQDLELGGAQVAYPGFQRGGGGGGGGGGASGPIYEKWGGGGGGGGAVQVRYTKSGGGGGGGASGPIYEKWGWGGASGPIYEKWGGGASGSIYEKWGGGGGGIPLQVRYLCAHRKYLHLPTYVLPRYTSHARANDAGKG